MYVISEQTLDSVFLSCDKILKKLHLLGLIAKKVRNNIIRFKKSNRCYVRKALIDADIDFFEDRIKQYEEILKVEKNKNWWDEDMDIKQLCKYFDRKEITIRKAIKKMCDNGFEQYKFLIKDKVVISAKGVEWLSKNVFKKKYLELLEEYKMELTEKYIEAGYPYDHFFGKN